MSNRFQELILNALTESASRDSALVMLIQLNENKIALLSNQQDHFGGNLALGCIMVLIGLLYIKIFADYLK